MGPLIRIFIGVAFCIALTGQAYASEQLAKDNGCLNCHKVDTQGVGPSLKDIAAKYKGDAGAEAALVDKVKKGGSGAWGSVPMPPNSPRVSDSDIQKMVKWILSM